MPKLSENQLRALRLVDCGTRMRLTHRGNVVVSQAAPKLRALGLIREAPERWIAYELTETGKLELERHAATIQAWEANAGVR